LNKLTREIRAGNGVVVDLLDTRDTRMLTRLTLPMSLAGIASFISNYPWHCGSSVTGLALAPLAVAGNIRGHEIEHPMAIVILDRLVTSTLLNLFVLPIAVPELREEQENASAQDIGGGRMSHLRKRK
jgi:hypothetical protein